MGNAKRKTWRAPGEWGKLKHAVIAENYGGGGLWPRDSCVAVKAFRYLRDGLFLLACSLYAINRCGVSPHAHSAFLRGHFNDLLLMPCALPPLLLLQRRLKLRTHDRMPSAGEIALYLAVWSILFEVIGPHIMRRATGDPWDVAAYVAGGIVAGLWWNRRALFPLRSIA